MKDNNRTIRVLEHKTKILEDQLNEVVNFVSKLNTDFEEYRETIADVLQEATDHITERLDNLEKE